MREGLVAEDAPSHSWKRDLITIDRARSQSQQRPVAERAQGRSPEEVRPMLQGASGGAAARISPAGCLAPQPWAVYEPAGAEQQARNAS